MSKPEDQLPESSAKVIVITETPPPKRQRGAGEYLMVSSDSLPSIVPPIVKILITNRSIICEHKTKNLKSTLVIDRYSGSLSAVARESVKIPEAAYEMQAVAILGVVNIQSERFLIVASECLCVAVLGSVQIFGISRADLIPFSIQPCVSDKSQSAEVAVLASGMERFLSTQGFFFSYDCDLTRPLTPSPGSLEHALDTGDDRFFWNREMLLEMTLLGSSSSDWIVPVVHGAVNCEELALNPAWNSRMSVDTSEKLNLVLISRRSRLRAYPRDAKGIDSEGNAGGYVETEQVLESGGVMASYIVARGSCPWVWAQSQGTGAAMIDEEATEHSLRKHIDGLMVGAGGNGSSFKSCFMMTVAGAGKDDGTSQVRMMESMLQRAKLSPQATVELCKIDPGVPAKPRSLQDLWLSPNIQSIMARASPTNRFAAASKQRLRAEIISAAGDGTQSILCRIDGADALDRTSVLQMLLARAALAGFVSCLAGGAAAGIAGEAAGLEGLAAEGQARWKAAWLCNAENLARQHVGVEPGTALPITAELLSPPATGKGGEGQGGSKASSLLSSVSGAVKAAGRAVKTAMTLDDADPAAAAHALRVWCKLMGASRADFGRERVHRELLAREVGAAGFWNMDHLKVFAGTWNVAGNASATAEELQAWFYSDPAGEADIYLIGLQEIVDLNAVNLLKDTSSSLMQASSSLWGGLSAAVTGGDVDAGVKAGGGGGAEGGGGAGSGESGWSEAAGQWVAALSAGLNGPGAAAGEGKYVVVASRQLVGVLATVFVRRELQEGGLVRNVALDMCRTGLMGSGTKGGVAIRVSLGPRLPPAAPAPAAPTTLCMIVAHMAAHIKYLAQRNLDYRTILSTIRFPSPAGRPMRPIYPQWAGNGESGSEGEEWLPPDILSHDAVVFLGDFNYRLDGIDSGAIKALISESKWEKLRVKDQLIRERNAGRTFLAFEELPVAFPPTYRYDKGTDLYDTSPKQRAPAWCDRVMFRGPHIQAEWYGVRGDVRSSDHKPVTCLLTLAYKSRFDHAAFAAAVEAANAAAQRALAAVPVPARRALLSHRPAGNHPPPLHATPAAAPAAHRPLAASPAQPPAAGVNAKTVVETHTLIDINDASTQKPPAAAPVLSSAVTAAAVSHHLIDLDQLLAPPAAQSLAAAAAAGPAGPAMGGTAAAAAGGFWKVSLPGSMAPSALATGAQAAARSGAGRMMDGLGDLFSAMSSSGSAPAPAPGPPAAVTQPSLGQAPSAIAAPGGAAGSSLFGPGFFTGGMGAGGQGTPAGDGGPKVVRSMNGRLAIGAETIAREAAGRQPPTPPAATDAFAGLGMIPPRR